ncbi:hypothetical protein ACO0RG_001296 [Hanseniaspora osmophila]|uniref:Protein farnesyltransferase subunit beta n=1 Tax=Hanseniaspora osmophila TaxID=56408 RepID=A0A1E5RP05_9ASCO|nr:Protein farnesyltransferase subunit beta [Hanseniaspora osmophila]
MESKTEKRAKYINSLLLGRKRDIKYEMSNTQPGLVNTEAEEYIDIDQGNDQSEKEDESVIPMIQELRTETTESKEETLTDILDCYNSNFLHDFNPQHHIPYLDFFLQHTLPPQMLALDASQPWMVYWLVNSLYIMQNGNIGDELRSRIKDKFIVQSSVSPFSALPRPASFGPFAGGIMQYPHLASNYAAILSLVLCEDEEVLSKIDKDYVYEWLMSLKLPDGSFETCEKCGETDTRGVYCALSIASLLGIMSEELVENSLDFLIKCQAYEGGFGGRPFEEAHGGYTFCALASLVIIIDYLHGAKKTLNNFIDVDMLLRWISARQDNEAFGLNGRSNKLVDGCYSFWIGGTGSILEAYGYTNPIDKEKLRAYILQCCQSDEFPGLRDKPGMRSDFYHTNYVLLGLCCVDSQFSLNNENHSTFSIEATLRNSKDIPGVAKINPIYGLPCSIIAKVYSWLSQEDKEKNENAI